MSADGEQGGVLLPCPFCGGEAPTVWVYREKHSMFPQWVVHCKLCNITQKANTKAYAILAWNTRATDTPDAATIALCATIVSEEGPQNPEHDWTDHARARASMRDRILKRFAALAKHPTSPEDAA